ncbi:MAG: hypothetical protein RE468_04315 [Acidithiobacillus caldus]|uniref:hypothetical protein n=1 Tax=Acidithiobacillus caldus TaxID=33059 RepID=UPI00281531BA|nr:hypothetical protein [Acidithiobacillus caldus]WMT47842.1 MAG: hypothetical protein RE468_04315 [Acidithiobacillus caldus]
MATLVGLVALALAILSPGITTITGLLLVVITALFGMGTLYVLAGRAPPSSMAPTGCWLTASFSPT